MILHSYVRYRMRYLLIGLLFVFSNCLRVANCSENMMKKTVRTMMRAVQVSKFGGPSVLEVQSNVPVPTPGPNDVLVNVKCAGINPVETYMRQGSYARLPPLPWTPGNDGAGIVAAVGANVTDTEHLKVGQRVWIAGSATGTYAEYCLCTDSQVNPLPDHVSFSQGAAVFVAFKTAYRALFTRIQTKAGSNVFVHGGSGAVGTAAVQLAVAHGCKVTSTAGTDNGMAILKALGAKAYNHRKDNYVEEILKDHPEKFDVVIEMLANVNLDSDMDLIAYRGAIVVVGNRGTIDNINPRKLMMTEGSIVGLLAAPEEELSAAIAGINGGLRSGALKPIVGPVFELDDAPQAHVEVIEHKNGSSGKIVLSMMSAEELEKDRAINDMACKL